MADPRQQGLKPHLTGPVLEDVGGDSNSDGQADNTDLAAFQAAYRSRRGMSNYRWYLDYNNDGMIDSTDYYQFLRRYKTGLNSDGSVSPIP
jgi:hypothetical protein